MKETGMLIALGCLGVWKLQMSVDGSVRFDAILKELVQDLIS
jgi:hypothetical protein